MGLISCNIGKRSNNGVLVGEMHHFWYLPDYAMRAKWSRRIELRDRCRPTDQVHLTAGRFPQNCAAGRCLTAGRT